ncbi:MAG: type II secretion system F family protein [Nitrospirota bacterium]|nr:type II secretion system F family protein [Nitrospirota bacterium]
MMDQVLLISIFVFLWVIVISWGIYVYFRSKQEVNDWSTRAKGQSLSQKANISEGKQHPVRDDVVKILERLGKISESKDSKANSPLRASLITAGYRSAKAPVAFLGARIFFGMLLGLGFLLFGSEVVEGKDPLAFPAFLVGAMCLGYYLPTVWLNRAVSSRQLRITQGFPDALDLMVVCVEAGLGLDQALARVGLEVKNGHPDLGEELNVLNLELRAGLSREQALRNLVSRTDLDDIRSLVALLIQTDRFGTSIGQALRVHSDSMRLKRRMIAESKAAQLPVKLMIPLILFIFPALMVVIIGPGAISLMRNLLPAMGGG